MVSKSRRVVAAAAAVADMSFALSGLSKDGFTFRVSCCFFFPRVFGTLVRYYWCIISGKNTIEFVCNLSVASYTLSISRWMFVTIHLAYFRCPRIRVQTRHVSIRGMVPLPCCSESPIECPLQLLHLGLSTPV